MGQQLVLGLVPRLKAWWRFNSWLGAFVRARKEGMPIEDARAFADETYPPTTDDLLYRMELRRKEGIQP